MRPIAAARCEPPPVARSALSKLANVGYDADSTDPLINQPAISYVMDGALLLIQVSRPIIWPVLPLVYLLGLHAASAELNSIAVMQMMVLTFPMNLIGCGLNDIFDYESDRLSPRRRTVWGAVIGVDQRPLVWRACLGMTPLVILAGAAARNWGNFTATVALVLMAWLYSVPPSRLKERPPLDSLANGLGYFLFPLTMGYSLGADPRSMPLRYYLLALSVCGIHALATAADYEPDKAAGHRTLASVYGRRTAATVAFFAFLITWLTGDFHSSAVRFYLGACVLAALASAILPTNRVIAIACTTIFAGFLLAGLCHLAAR
jgi:4-hydroxybenzoate polyprenyltransferase